MTDAPSDRWSASTTTTTTTDDDATAAAAAGGGRCRSRVTANQQHQPHSAIVYSRLRPRPGAQFHDQCTLPGLNR